MNCSWCEARLAPYVDGELGPRERAILLAHVDGCAPCAGVLEELRVVDALLLEPHRPSLAPNFTFATMAEIRELPPPCSTRLPFAAFAVCYLVGSWLLIAAAFVLAPDSLRAAALTVLAVVRTVLEAFGGIGHVAARLAGGAVLGVRPMLVIGSIVAINGALAFAALALVRRAHPANAERLRS